jgi:hypothetical protein
MQRPGGVTVIAIIDYIGAGLCVIGGIAAFFGGAFLGAMLGGSASHSGAGAGMGMIIGGAIGVFLLFLAAISGVAGWGLWSLKEWARIVQIVLAALGVLGRLFSIMTVMAHGRIFGLPFSLVILGYYAWVIYYLIQPEVKAAFVQQPVRAYMPPPTPPPVG